MEQRERDCRLVSAVVGGDQKAFAELCRIYYEPLRRFVGARMVYTDMVDDVVQIAFMRVHKILPEHDADTPFWPFLQQVARLVVYEELRRAKRFPSRQTDPVLEVMAERNADYMDQNMDGMLDSRLKTLEACLSELNKTARTIFYKIYSECRKIKEVAREANLTPNTLSARLYRWKKDLATCIERNTGEQAL